VLRVDPIMTPSLARAEAVQRAVDKSTSLGEEEKEALQELEGYFVSTLMKEMRKTVQRSGLLGDGFSMRAYEEMLDDALSKEAARSGQFGIARLVEEQLSIQELQHQLKG